MLGEMKVDGKGNWSVGRIVGWRDGKLSVGRNEGWREGKFKVMRELNAEGKGN